MGKLHTIVNHLYIAKSHYYFIAMECHFFLLCCITDLNSVTKKGTVLTHSNLHVQFKVWFVIVTILYLNFSYAGMGSSSVPLVDVNSSTAEATWPLLIKAIRNADFISLDLVRSSLQIYLSN